MSWAAAVAAILVALPGCAGEDGEPEGSPALDRELIAAAGRGDAAEVRRLLDEGASVAAVGEGGATALVAAAYGDHVEVARLLIEEGADVNAKDATEQSGYLIPTADGSLELLELMLAHGGDVRSLDSYRGTGLIRAADRGHVEIVRRLLETEIEVDHVNRLGWTALLEAIILGDGGARHMQIVRLLVDAGANVNLADGNGVTPLEHARRQGFEEIESILEAAGGRAS